LLRNGCILMLPEKQRREKAERGSSDGESSHGPGGQVCTLGPGVVCARAAVLPQALGSLGIRQWVLLSSGERNGTGRSWAAHLCHQLWNVPPWVRWELSKWGDVSNQKWEFAWLSESHPLGTLRLQIGWLLSVWTLRKDGSGAKTKRPTWELAVNSYKGSKFQINSYAF
jgi:hypothetical protein